jgi:hypothetical protein
MAPRHPPAFPGVRLLARSGGSAIAAPGATPWVIDFLDAAYFRRPRAEREVDDLRFATSVLTTRSALVRRRLRARDLLAFHLAFGPERRRGTLSRTALERGATRLFGPWFAEAYADPARHGWGICFRVPAGRLEHDPEARLRRARIGPLTPPGLAGRPMRMHTYAPVELPSAAGAVAALAEPESWPGHGSARGRLTPLRRGALAGQTFEIEVAAGAGTGRPPLRRAYVSVTGVLGRDDPAALGRHVAGMTAGLRAHGAPDALPEGATPVLAVDLTTHAGRVLGPGCSRLLVYEHAGRAWIREVDAWDAPANPAAPPALWSGDGDPDTSMLHQISLRAETR